MFRSRYKRGFTIVEMLSAMLIVALLGAAVAAGVSVGTRVYRDSVFLSESDILRSTLNTALSDVLRYAAVVETDEFGNVQRFDCANYSITGGSVALSADGRLVYCEFSGDTEHELVNKGAYTSLALADFSLAYDAATGVFSGGYTITWQNHGELARDVAFTFRSIA